MSHLENAEDIDFITKTAIERDPKKRRVKPVDNQTSLLDFDLGESSDDSDFRIEDHAEESDDDSIDSNGEGGKGTDGSSVDEEEDSDESDDEEELNNLKVPSDQVSIANVMKEAANRQNNDKLLQMHEKDVKVLVCSGCLGDRSDDVNEIVECDGCGVTVHEACYGVSDTASVMSTESDYPTEPWFCEACRAGVTNPTCELCPNSGGIFKETDVGKWVHLVCALYVPGVAFGEVDHLSSVTLFEMPYNKWGAKSCSLCQDERFTRTGVCIGCDAGMCRTYFHVTCAQREGFLSEAHSEEVDQADPFYAHCKLHSDKTLVKRRKRNYLALQLNTQYRRLQFEQAGHQDTPEQVRIQRKLNKHKIKFLSHKTLKSPPWVPTQKMPRLLTTSASACRKLLRKAELMGIDTVALEMQEAQLATLADVRKKWHIPPAFSVEFIAYYLDRNDRLKLMKTGLSDLLHQNTTLLDEQQQLRFKYDKMMKDSSEESRVNITLKQTIHKYHSAILSACPNKNFPSLDDLGKPAVPRAPQPTLMVPTAAALKMGVGFPLSNMPAGRHDTGRVLSSHAKQADSLLLNECGICRQRRDQHLLAKCDTCHLYYHLGCLNPPLTRLPKKSKLYGWQCSECDKTSDSEAEVEVKTPRRSRTRYSKEGPEHLLHSNDSSATTTPNFTPKVKIKPMVEPPPPPQQQQLHELDNNSHVLLHMKKYASEADVASPPRADLMNSSNHVSSPPSGDASGPQAFGPPPPQHGNIVYNSSLEIVALSTSKSAKKRRREKHRNRYSPDVGGAPLKEHKRKRKKKSLDIENPNPHPRITIKIKSIPLPAGEVASTSNPQRFYVPNENNDIPPPLPPLKPALATLKASPPPTTTAAVMSTRVSTSRHSAAAAAALLNNSGGASVAAAACSTTPTAAAAASSRRSGGATGAAAPKIAASELSMCDVCHGAGTNANLVRCDECQKCYHFTCLEPPVKKTPKRRGYSWHCADCDPTGSESN